jgi:adenylate cyclase
MSWRRRAVAGAAGVALLIAGFVGWDFWAGSHSQLRVFIAQAAQPVPTMPSIIVMPFLNASENEDQDYFCLGMAEDIITSLTKVRGLFVVGRDSALSFKGKAVPARQVGRELGVRYVLQGSVRRADNRVRISTYLVDAATERTVWAARYDRELGDVFAVQDDIAGKIVNAVSVSFQPGERENIQQQYAMAPKFSAYDLFLQAREKMHPPTAENLNAAKERFQEAVKLDPNFSGGYEGLSRVASLEVMQGINVRGELREAALKDADDNAAHAVRLNPRAPMSKMVASSVSLLKNKPQEAVSLAKEAYESQPGDTYIAATYALTLTFAGDTETALGLFDKARPGPLDVALERERVPVFRLRALFFKMFAAYEAGIYRVVDESYKTLLKSGGVCFANCLAYAGAAKLHLAKEADTAHRAADKDLLEMEIADIATLLKTKFPAYQQRVRPWLAMYAGGESGERARRFKADVDTLYNIRTP